MGVTVQCEGTGRAIDLDYGGFARLRYKVAELAGKEWHDHYKQGTLELLRLCSADRLKKGREFDRKTEQLLKEKKVCSEVVDFCLQSDAEGSVAAERCKVLLQIIGDHDDNILYGYAERKDCAKFRDFKAILEDCVQTGTVMTWW